MRLFIVIYELFRNAKTGVRPFLSSVRGVFYSFETELSNASSILPQAPAPEP